MDSRLKLTIPRENIEAGAWEQIQAALALPYLKALAIMPDVHSGYDLPIGGVALLDGYIWPGAVGYDIGCGMCHVNTEHRLDQLSVALDHVYTRILRMVPVGFSVNEKPRNNFDRFSNASGYACLNDAIMHKAGLQVGTLGGGNHFIEVGVNNLGEIGVTIHSGSRRPGWLIADFYMRQTKGPVRLESDLGQQYLVDMTWAQNFALLNRSRMMFSCLQTLGFDEADAAALMGRMVNENHNHAIVTPDGVLHRKGATPADKGQLGIIPANMRDGVWITEGLGNEEFLSSASHGAGRTMSRTKAKKLITTELLFEQMRGIIAPPLSELLDEGPDAYKEIHGVLAAQDGRLVNVIDHFEPMLVVKG